MIFKKKVPPTNRILTKKVTPTNRDFGRKFRKFETKSKFFPNGKIEIQNFPKYDKFISIELYVSKFGAKSENLNPLEIVIFLKNNASYKFGF